MTLLSVLGGSNVGSMSVWALPPFLREYFRIGVSDEDYHISNNGSAILGSCPSHRQKLKHICYIIYDISRLFYLARYTRIPSLFSYRYHILKPAVYIYDTPL
jgi:hypothetical protein